MIELERARAHLLRCQEILCERRRVTGWANYYYDSIASPNKYIERAEDSVCAALSWVWEEQEREGTDRIMGAWLHVCEKQCDARDCQRVAWQDRPEFKQWLASFA